MKPTLVVPDLHAPFVHPKALSFCKKVYQQYGCRKTVLLGDVADLHALSFYDADPDGFGPGDELVRARREIRKWYTEWPKALVCVGNHDNRGHRRAYKYGIPRTVVRSLNEIYETPKWEYALRFDIDGVLYTHGSKYSGITAHKRAAERNRQSTVIGHVHAHAGVHYLACPKDLIFGMNTGCLIDATAYAMEYGIDLDTKPVLGCGVVMSKREAHFVPMNLGERK